MARDKNYYQRQINKYVNKREKYKSLLGEKSPDYLAKRVLITKKLRGWRECLRKISKRHDSAIRIYNGVEEFLGQKPYSSEEGRALFIKWGMEHHLEGAFLANFIHHSNPSLVYRIRSNFTKSFQKHRENKELWDRFRLFMRDREEDCVALEFQ